MQTQMKRFLIHRQVFSNSKESSERPIIGLSSPKKTKSPQREVFLKLLVVFCDNALLC